MRVSHNYAQIGLNDPLNDILKTAEVVRGALGDIKSICSSEDILNVVQQTRLGGRL